MATRAILTAASAEFPASNGAALTTTNTAERRAVLAFDAATEEFAAWTLIAPQGWTGALTAVLTVAFASATTGGAVFGVAVEAISAGDAVDTDAATSYDAENLSAAIAAPTVAGHIAQASVALTTHDASAPADLLRVRVARKVADAGDTATGDCLLFAVELRDAA